MERANLAWPRWVALSFSLGLVWLAIRVDSSPPLVQAPKATPEQITFFETKVRPVLANNCYGCHGPTSQMAGLRVDSQAALLKGGDSGPAIVPGDAEKSLLIKSVHQTGPLKMPKGGKLKPAEVADLDAWVKMGAPWPAAVEKTEPKDVWWSLQPIKNPPAPKVKATAKVRNPIDAFVLAKLEANKHTLSAEADKRTLLRRVTFDLIGLPPTMSEMEDFLADKTPTAYDKVVDRLLASPRYGERWARLWLDVARYADTKGYVFEEDRTYYNAYTYRDWVINAFNQDLPYDQFITQQIAADRIPEVQNGDDKHPLAALGFLTVGRRFLNNPPDIIDDRIDVTMRGFQGFTVACARCHDHKFDPIPTQDYYSLYAVFASSMERESPISEKPIRDPWERHNGQQTLTEKNIRELVTAQITRLRNMVKVPDQEKNVAAEVKQALMGFREGTIPEGENFNKVRKGFESAASEKLTQLMATLEELKRTAPTKPEFAMAMTDVPNPGDGVVFKRGNPGSHGEPAPRRFLKALSPEGAERMHWKTSSGRLDLAKAIASRENPLTARVLVNRVWQNHFGMGIVRTPSDFGRQGERPTHPELLDYLATNFMNNGWSVKKLQKLMVTSATYRQTATATPEMLASDPDNRNLGRMNRHRLDLEQMRDSVMLAAGRLELSKVGGKSVDIWGQPFATRRAVYGFIERQNLPGTFRTFDFASPDSTSPRRFLTTVPQQALFMMNSPFAIEQARAMTDRAEIQNAADDKERIVRLYRLLFARSPDQTELSVGLAYLKPGGLTTMMMPAGLWSYGYGAFDASKQRVSSFTAFPYFGDNSYRVSKTFPDPNLGYLILNGQGGHPGRDASRAVIRRWTAPAAMTVLLAGLLKHPQAQGDGVRAKIVSSRVGLLGEWTAHNNSMRTDVGSVAVQKGDTIDFVLDPISNESFDATEWSPVIRSTDGKQSWNAAADFGPPPPPPLKRVTMYAQALMMTNEFLFVD